MYYIYVCVCIYKYIIIIFFIIQDLLLPSPNHLLKRNRE